VAFERPLGRIVVRIDPRSIDSVWDGLGFLSIFESWCGVNDDGELVLKRERRLPVVRCRGAGCTGDERRGKFLMPFSRFVEGLNS